MAKFNKFKPEQAKQAAPNKNNEPSKQKDANNTKQNTQDKNGKAQVAKEDDKIVINENWNKAKLQNNETLFERASRLYQEFVAKELQKYKLAKADEAWMKKIMTDGTLKDKISAISIYIRDNPKSTLAAMENLMTFANTKSMKDIIQCYNALKGIFLESVMPKTELKTFMQSTKGKSNISDKDLVEIYYQHKLKEIFYKYVNSLISHLNDNLFFFRRAMLLILIDIVMKRQECQELILSALLNKLGDSDKKIVTILNQNLGKILYKKGDLILPLIKEIERFLFRPNLKIQSQFYAINFLNTVNYSIIIKLCNPFLTSNNKKSSEAMKEIIKLLFILFKKMIDAKEEDLLASKILSQILRGINKIFPHTKKNFEQFKEFFAEKIEELYKLIHQTTSIKIRIQTLLFIFQVENQENNLTDRYYRVLYELLVDPDVTHSSQTELFFDLLFFSLKADPELNRVKSFIKRLLQHAIHCEPPFIITSLMFVGKMVNAQPGIKTMIQQSERFFEDNEEDFKDIADSDDEVEQFKDADESDKIEEEQQKENKVEDKIVNEDQEQKKKEKQKTFTDYMGYDPFKREPRFTGCGESCFWELTVLIRHNHPTVRKFTDIILTSQKSGIDYKGNPLLDFTVANFLDRLSFKTAKKKESVGMKNLKAKGKIRMSKLESALQVDDVMKMDQRKIREEEKFFLRFFQQKQKKREGIEKKPKRKDFEDFAGDDEAEVDAFADQLAEEQLDSDFYDEDEPFSMSDDPEDDDEDDQNEGDFDGEEGDEFVDDEDDDEDMEEEEENGSKADKRQKGQKQKKNQNDSEDDDDENDLMIGDEDDDEEDDNNQDNELESQEIPENYDDSEEEQYSDEEDDFDEDELGDIDDLEQDLANDKENMGLEDSDYEDDDIEDFGTLLEKAGVEEDLDDRKKFGKQVGSKNSKTKSIKKEQPKPKGEKKPRHAKTAALKKQNKKAGSAIKKGKGGAKGKGGSKGKGGQKGKGNKKGRK